jgi:hypothetical protein
VGAVCAMSRSRWLPTVKHGSSCAAYSISKGAAPEIL